jgi:hypothetical protein
MKYFNFTIYISFLLLLQSCFSKKNITHKHESENQNSARTVQLEWDKSTFLKQYIDSLNISSKTKIIPNFLSDACFDYKNKFYWSPKHNPQSFRKKIIFSIQEAKTILFLIENKNLISDEKCKELLEHPYGGNSEKIDGQEITNLEFLESRLKQLR